jgi:hypothetical protein
VNLSTSQKVIGFAANAMVMFLETGRPVFMGKGQGISQVLVGEPIFSALTAMTLTNQNLSH